MVFFLRDVSAQAISLISCNFVVSLATAADLYVKCNKLAKRENRR